MHMQAASTLAPLLLKGQEVSPNPSILSLDNRKEWQNLTFLSPDDHRAINFLLGTFTWIDILGSISTGAPPILELDHIVLLESGKFDLEALVGCQNWILVVICRINVLDGWRKEAESKRQLSIAELAKQATDIEVYLRGRLSETLAPDPEEGYLDRCLESPAAEISRIFALSALTYLHTVVSGANADLPEIRESVSITIAAFEALSDVRLVRGLVWPFFITGSLAIGKQRDVFRQLSSKVDPATKMVGSYMEAFCAIQDCWTRRDRQVHDCDFVAGKTYSSDILLI